MIITAQIQDELRRIQSELKAPFPAELHEVRDLPGGGKKWVFLKWQTIRERLDEVAPDWQTDHSEIQYLGNDAICRCGLTILGVRKEAIASVPITLTSSSGKDMARGSAADRLAAEAIKNSAEAWGVGRYLDDQKFTIQYLWDRRSQLSDQMEGEVRRLAEQYRLENKPTYISKPKKSVDIVPSSGADRNLLNAEIDSVLKRRNMSVKQAQDALQELFSVRSRQHLSEDQLKQFLEYLRTPVNA